MHQRKKPKILPTLSYRQCATPVIEPGKAPTVKQKLQCWTLHCGSVHEFTCPGCFQAKIYQKHKNGWEASHVIPRSLGGPPHSFNLYPLCKNCNQAMQNQNMFLYFYREEKLSVSLLQLIESMHHAFEIEYNSQYKRFQGQFTRLAKFYFLQEHSNDGKIPVEHPIWKQFLQYDIQKNNTRVANIQKSLNEARELALEVSKEWESRCSIAHSIPQ